MHYYQDSKKFNQNLPSCHPKINFHIIFHSVWDSTIGIVTKLWADRSGVKISAVARDLFLFRTSKPAPAPTQPPTQWVPGAFSLAVKWTERSLTTQLQLVPRLRTSGSITPLPMCASMACTGTT